MRHDNVPQPEIAACLAVALLVLPVAAGIVETQDHRIYEGTVSWTDAGHLSIQTSNGVVQKLALDEVQFARVQSAPVEPRRLPRGWRGENIGQVQGSSEEKAGVFALSASGGTVKDSRQQAGHFAHRIVRGDGELMARVESMTGPALCLAGVMLREDLEPTGGFALLAITPDKQLRLVWREAGWRPLNQREFAAVRLPLWLKLSREEKTKIVTAFRSADGTNWLSVGQTPLGCKMAPFPDGSDTWRPKVYAGLAVTSAGTEAVADARFDQVALTVRGLLGEYFADSRFKTFRFARPDPKIEFFWGMNSPSPDIPEDHFGVRWTGQVEPRFSEPYRFHLAADNDATLWVDGGEIPTASFKNDTQGKEVPLIAGRKYDVKLEFKEGAGAAAVRLGWNSRSQPLEVIPASQLSYTFRPGSPDEEAEAEEIKTNAFFAKGVWLCNGSLVAGAIRSCDEHVARIAFAGRSEYEIARSKVARVVFQTPRRPLSFDAAQDRTGVFLKNGDFLESEFQSLDGRSLKVGSVLLGRRTFRLDGGEVVALVLRPCVATEALWEVRLLSGSLLRARALRPARDSVLVEDTTLGEIEIPQSDLLEIRRAAATTGAARGKGTP